MAELQIETKDIDTNFLQEKLSLLTNKQSIFICGAMDHSPQEIIKSGEIYSSAFVIYTSDFHRDFINFSSSVKVSKWSRAGEKYKKNFFKRWIPVQDLPFFAYVCTASGDRIYSQKQRIINDLGLQNIINMIETAGKKIDVYREYIDGKLTSFELPEKISISALYIAYFAVKSFFSFKDFCKENNLSFHGDPFQIFHDNFPSDNSAMANIVADVISLSRLNGYPTRTMSLYTWGTDREMPDDLLADNYAGLFHRIASGRYAKDKINNILSSNKTVVRWENWK